MKGLKYGGENVTAAVLTHSICFFLYWRKSSKRPNAFFLTVNWENLKKNNHPKGTEISQPHLDTHFYRMIQEQICDGKFKKKNLKNKVKQIIQCKIGLRKTQILLIFASFAALWSV